MNLNMYFYVLFTMSGVGFISWNNNMSVLLLYVVHKQVCVRTPHGWYLPFPSWLYPV